MFNFLEGYRTYIIGTGFIMFGLGGWIINALEPAEAIQNIMTGLGFFGLRLAIKKIEFNNRL